MLQFEKSFPHATVEAMKAMGYTVSQVDEADTKTPGVWGGSELIEVDPKTEGAEGRERSALSAGQGGELLGVPQRLKPLALVAIGRHG